MTARYFPDANTIKLLRIPFSIFLMPVFLIAVSQAPVIHLFQTVTAFIIIHLLIYPASNGYNSYVDRDATSIGGLENPPMPTVTLFYTTMVMDGLALILGLVLIGKLFSFLILIYILASRSYSAPVPRLKKYPIIGFLTVFFFQGAFTYYMSSVAINNNAILIDKPMMLLMLATSFQIAGAYPLTQIYQHKEDKENGDISLSLRLGYIGTFIFTALMFGICNLCYYLYFEQTSSLNSFYLLQAFFLPVIIYFVLWFLRVYKNNAFADFKSTMKMNTIASLSMSACFITLILINHIF